MIYRFVVDTKSDLVSFQLKKYIRTISHQVEGCDEEIGPYLEFERYKKLIKRNLTKREMVCGVKGFKALLAFHGEPSSLTLTVDTARAKMCSADDWIIEFVREIIQKAGWKILEEKNYTVQEYLRKL